YLDALARQPLGLNVGAHLSHAPLRVYAMGDRGARDEAPTDAELDRMRQCVREAMHAGALGFDTGRTTVHRTPTWDPVQGTFADPRELAGLAAGLSDAGRGVLELISYGGAGEDAEGYKREFEWMVPIARDSRRPISLSMVQNLAYPEVWRDMLRRAEQAGATGARIVPQVAGGCVGGLFGVGIALAPLSLYPPPFDLVRQPGGEPRVRS